MDVEKRVAQFVQVRELIRKMEAKHEEELAQLKMLRDSLKVLLLNYLNMTKQEAARTSSGTAHIINKVSATVEDGAAFRQFCIDGNWALADLRANGPRVDEWRAENEGQEVPGVKFTKFRDIGIRKA
jgi:hypothetical protein